MALGIQVLPWDMHKNVVGLNRLMESEPAPLNNWITHGYADSNNKP